MRQHLAVAVDHEAQQGRAFLTPQLRLARILLVALEPGPQHVEIVRTDAGLAAAGATGIGADRGLLAHAGLSSPHPDRTVASAGAGSAGAATAALEIIGRRRLGWRRQHGRGLPARDGLRLRRAGLRDLGRRCGFRRRRGPRCLGGRDGRAFCDRGRRVGRGRWQIGRLCRRRSGRFRRGRGFDDLGRGRLRFLRWHRRECVRRRIVRLLRRYRRGFGRRSWHGSLGRLARGCRRDGSGT